MSKVTIVGFLMAATLPLYGCVSEGEESPELQGDTRVELGAGELDVEATAVGLSGTYTLGDDVVTFSATQVETGVTDVMVSVNGMLLAAIIDDDSALSELDGFAAIDGNDTAMQEADRRLVDAFSRELEASDFDETRSGDMLRRVTSMWGEHPDPVPLQRMVAGQENRADVSWCDAAYQWRTATHDCDHCGNYEQGCTTDVFVGYHWGERPHYSNSSGYIGWGWVEGILTHPSLNDYYWDRNWRYAGECLGNCGGGCPTGNQTLTQDCADHDHCVAHGNHYMTSVWCNDEFVVASDDYMFMPSCANTERPAINPGGIVNAFNYSAYDIHANGIVSIFGRNFGILGGNVGSNVVKYRNVYTGQTWAIGVGSYAWYESRFQINATVPNWTGYTCAHVWAHGFDTQEVCFNILP